MANLVDYAEANVCGTTTKKDQEEILRLHNEWWQSNYTLDVSRMAENFPAGDKYLMFNLQGHPYYGIEEKKKLWEYYHSQIELKAEHIRRIVRFEIRGDIAWIATEKVEAFNDTGDRGLGGESTGVQSTGKKTRSRTTAIFHRDDGNGNPEWKIWHIHSSPAPDADEPRPAFDDTARSRGELIP